MDLRIQRSKQFLWQAFFSLMTTEKTLFDKITINQICQKAFVHRSTFYAHFEDKYALLRFGFQELWADYLSLPAAKRALEPFKTAETFFQNTQASQLMTQQKHDPLFTAYSQHYFFQLLKADAQHLLGTAHLASSLPADLFSEIYLSTLETLSQWAEKNPEKNQATQLDCWFNQIMQLN